MFSLDIFGDKWSLIILRDLLIGGKSHFSDFLRSPERIASNILSNRLELFVQNGLTTKHADPTNKSAAIYRPTQKALDLLPLIFEMMRWGIAHNPNSKTDGPVMSLLLNNPEAMRKQILNRFREGGSQYAADR